MRHRKVMGFIAATAMVLLLVACGSDKKEVVDIGITPGTKTITMGQQTTFAVATTNTDYTVSTDKAAAGCVKTNATTVTCTPTAAGEYVVTVTATADKNKTKTATLVVNEVIITISPETTTIKAGETATLTLSSGSAEVNWPTAVAGGTLTPSADGKSATFTSNAPNTYTITVTAKADTNISKTTNVIVKPAEPTVFIKSGATATVEQNKAVRFDAEVSFPAGQPENTPKWAVVGEDCGSVEPSEGAYTVYTAPATPKTCKVTASVVNVEQETITFEASVTVTPPEEIAGMVYVEPGEFTMGCNQNQDGFGSNCVTETRPKHQVTWTEAFYIGENEVTQAEWKALMDGDNPSINIGDNLPVNNVGYDDIKVFIDKLNERDAALGRIWRLPYEAEWEYAARGGVKGTGLTGCGYNSSDPNLDFIWAQENSDGQLHPVGTKLPNELGLHDMCGNVEEFVEDWYARYSGEDETDPHGPDSPNARNARVYRGGGINVAMNTMSVAYRRASATVMVSTPKSGTLGFRLALTITEPEAPTAEPTFFESASTTVSGLWDSITK